MSGPLRTLVVWCPDWPVVAASAAADVAPHVPAAVFTANRVVACSAIARVQGVHRGLRRREAQSRCPELAVFDDDPSRDARLFEPVAVAVESVAPGIEVVRPGLVAVPARGPASYFGSEHLAAERIVDEIAARTDMECQVGIADGLFAATLAARRGRLVPIGESADFLAPLSIAELEPADQHADDRRDLIGLLRRLGIRTLGAFAALPAADVASRFGSAAVGSHRLASGTEERPPARRDPPRELAVAQAFDPPVDRVDTAAFIGRSLAGELHAKLAGAGLSCTRLGISAHTAHGDELSRVWRCAEPLTLAGTADRVRWQLDGWLTGRSGARPRSGLTTLTLAPAEVVSASALQLDLWQAAGQETAHLADRAGRAMVRVQGMLGPEAVLTAVLGGGRGPADRVRLVPWGDERQPVLSPTPPWPGRLPEPSPSVIPQPPPRAVVLDDGGEPIGVTDRSAITAPPRQVIVGDESPRQVAGWAGPWPVDERWWADLLPTRSHTTARVAGLPARQAVHLQVVLEPAGDLGQLALLLSFSHGAWFVAGVYA